MSSFLSPASVYHSSLFNPLNQCCASVSLFRVGERIVVKLFDQAVFAAISCVFFVSYHHQRDLCCLICVFLALSLAIARAFRSGGVGGGAAPPIRCLQRERRPPTFSLCLEALLQASLSQPPLQACPRSSLKPSRLPFQLLFKGSRKAGFSRQFQRGLERGLEKGGLLKGWLQGGA